MAITTPGAVDYHLAVQSGNLALNALSPLTLMCWINTTLWTGGARVSMVGTYNSATAGGTAVQIGTSAGGGTADAWTWGGTVLVSSSTVPPVQGGWGHYAYTFDGTTHSLYVNGVLSGTGTTAQQAGTLGSIFINGYPTGGTAETGAFSVDDVSYYSRALSAAEILTAYTTGGERDGIHYGCVASILFSEGYPGNTVASALDYSGNTNIMTPLGGATGVNFVYATSFIEHDTRPPLG